MLHINLTPLRVPFFFYIFRQIVNPITKVKIIAPDTIPIIADMLKKKVASKMVPSFSMSSLLSLSIYQLYLLLWFPIFSYKLLIKCFGMMIVASISVQNEFDPIGT